jgi:hypothetical protein
MTIIIGKDGNTIDRIEGVIFAGEFESKVKPLLKKSIYTKLYVKRPGR